MFDTVRIFCALLLEKPRRRKGHLTSSRAADLGTLRLESSAPTKWHCGGAYREQRFPSDSVLNDQIACTDRSNAWIRSMTQNVNHQSNHSLPKELFNARSPVICKFTGTEGVGYIAKPAPTWWIITYASDIVGVVKNHMEGGCESEAPSQRKKHTHKTSVSCRYNHRANH